MLLDKFHGLDLEKISRLTDRQIQDLYCHKRDTKDGTIELPIEEIVVPVTDEPETLEKALADVDLLTAIFHFPPEHTAELKRQLEEKYVRGS